jgi:hypothetical protein
MYKPMSVVQTPQHTMMNGIHSAGLVRFIIMLDGTFRAKGSSQLGVSDIVLCSTLWSRTSTMT